MKKHYWLPTLLTFIYLATFSQDSLDLGRTVHYLKKYLPQNRKWIILDFYNTRCASCVSSFPRFDQLQKEFANEIDIILVCEDRVISREFRQKYLDMRIAKQINFDSVLPRLFKHRAVSHCVWLDPDLRVRGFTGKEDVNPANILGFVEGKLDTLVTKRDFPKYNPGQPFNGFQFRSVLTGALPGFASSHGEQLSEDGKIHTAYFINTSRAQLIRVAYLEKANKILNHLTIPGDTIICYELVMPYRKRREDYFRHLRFDLYRYFNIRPRGAFFRRW